MKTSARSFRLVLLFLLVLAVTLILASFIDNPNSSIWSLLAWVLFFALCGTYSWRAVRLDWRRVRAELAQVVDAIRQKGVREYDYQSMNIPIAIMELDEEGRIRAPNRAALKLLSIKNNEKPKLAELVSGLGQPVETWVNDVLEDRIRQQSEFAVATRSEDELYLQVQLVRNQERILAVITDATELKTLEAQFVQSQKMQAIGQLAGGIAHDFNNLLTAISGYCDLLLLRHEKGDPDHSDLVQISNNANRAAFLVSHLLAYSRKQLLKPATVQINDTLADMTHLLNRLVGETITVHLDRAKNLPLVFADMRQLEQVIMNLVVNARDAMPDGGNIRISSSHVQYDAPEYRETVPIRAGEYVVIEVADEGVGIPQNVRERVFEPFFTTKDVGKGTGLGLSMAYGIMKQMGGYIFADPGPEHGTVFTLFLKIDESGSPDVPQIPKKSDQRLGNLSGLRVLLVEDEDPVLAVSKRALQSQGVILETAQTGREALERVENAPATFDVVVTDVVMPDMDGPTWVAEAQKGGFDAKIIFVSGYARETLNDKWGQMDDAMFLPKPYSLKDLIETVELAGHVREAA